MGRPAPVRSRQHTTAHRAQDPDPFLLLGPRTDHPSGPARAGALCARVITLRFARPGLSRPGGPPSPLSPLSSSNCLSVLLTPSRAPLLYLSPNPPRVACRTVFHPLSVTLALGPMSRLRPGYHSHPLALAQPHSKCVRICATLDLKVPQLVCAARDTIAAGKGIVLMAWTAETATCERPLVACRT